MIDRSTTATPAPSKLGAGQAGRRNRWGLPLKFVVRYGVFAVYLLMVIAFSVMRPDAFLQFDTVRSILVDAAVLGAVAAALTIVLAIGEFDLSFGNVAGLAAAIAVYCMTVLGFPIVIAVLIALLIGALAGVVNGVTVSYGRVPALIATLAVGSMALGLERSIWQDDTIYAGIPGGYMDITEFEILGVPMIVFISITVVAAFSLLASFTVFGRRIYAVGGGEEASRIAGIRTKRIRVAAFTVMGAVSALAGVLLSSLAASYYPRSGSGLLLPAFAACFLGWSAAGASRFYPAFTYFGVIFMGTLSTGLIMIHVPTWVNDLVQGAVLVFAVLVARAARAK